MQDIADLAAILLATMFFIGVCIFCFEINAPIGAIPAAIIFFHTLEERLT